MNSVEAKVLIVLKRKTTLAAVTRMQVMVRDRISTRSRRDKRTEFSKLWVMS